MESAEEVLKYINDIVDIRLSKWKGNDNVKDKTLGVDFTPHFFGKSDDRNSEDYLFFDDDRNIYEFSDQISLIRNFFNKEYRNGKHVNGFDDDTGHLVMRGHNYNAGLFMPFTGTSFDDEMMNALEGSYKKGEPKVNIIKGDLKNIILNAEGDTIFQVPSNFNTLANPDKWSSNMAGIESYKNQKTLSAKAALSCIAGTLVRNYALMDKFGGQFNSLSDMFLSHLNGYLIWSDKPEDVNTKMKEMNVDMGFLRLGVMLNTGVNCIVRDSKGLRLIGKGTSVNLIFTPSPQYNEGGNGGNEEIQRNIIEIFLIYNYAMSFYISLLINNRNKKPPVVYFTLNERQEIWCVEAIKKVLSRVKIECVVNIILDEECNSNIEGVTSMINKSFQRKTKAPVIESKKVVESKKVASPVVESKKVASPVVKSKKVASPVVESKKVSSEKSERPITNRSKAYKHAKSDMPRRLNYKVDEYNDEKKGDANNYLVYNGGGSFSELNENEKKLLSTFLSMGERDTNEIKSGNLTLKRYKDINGDDYLTIIDDENEWSLINRYSPWILHEENSGEDFILYDSNDNKISEMPLKGMFP